MKSKITKIQNLFMKGIAIIVSAVMSITPVVYATTNLDDNGDFNLSIIDQILYGKVGATAKEIEKYFAEGHTTLYISSEIQLRALAEYVNSAHKDTPTSTCNGDHSCYGKEIILTRNIELSSEEWEPIGKALTTTATETSGSGTGSSSIVIDSEDNGEGAIIDEELEDNGELDEYVPDETEGDNIDVDAHTKEDESIANALFNTTEEIITTSTSFEGTFDGNGHTILNLKFTKPGKTYKDLKNIGLFGVTGKNSIIKNLTVDSFNIDIPWEDKDILSTDIEGLTHEGQYSNAGNIVGYNQGIIEYCANNSNISGLDNVGGIAGYSTGNIKNCKNSGKVNGYAENGGIVGHVKKATIENCINISEVSGKEEVGGIAGIIDESTVNNCSNKASIEDGNMIGGIVGSSCKSTITSVNNYGNVKGKNSIGGIVGFAGETKIANVLNNGEDTKSVFGKEKNVGGIVGTVKESVINRVVNKMPVRGKSAVGGIVGWSVKTNIYYVYNMDSISTETTAKYDVIGVEKVGGLVGALQESTLRRSGTTAEVLGVSNKIGGAVGYITDGNYSEEYSAVNKVAVLGGTRLDVDHWTFSSETNGTYNNTDNPVVQKMTIDEPCYGVGSIVGFLNPTKGKTTVTNNYIFGNVVGMKATGGAVGWITSSTGIVDVSGIIRDEAYTYILSKVNTTSDSRQFKMTLKGKDEKGQNISESSISQTSKLGYGLKYTGLIYGVNNNKNTSSYFAKSYYTKENLGNNYADKLFKDSEGKYADGTTTEKYEDNTVKYGIYGVEYLKSTETSSLYYNFKVQPKETASNITLPIVNHEDKLETNVIGSNLDESSMLKVTKNNVEGTVGNYTVKYKLYKNNTEVTGETYLKSGDKLKVEATINAPIANVIDISNSITKLTTETAPTLTLKNGDNVIATVKPKSISNVTTNSTETTFTYEYDITEETSANNEKINKVLLNKVGTLYVVGTTSQITNSKFGEAETTDILFDEVAPEIITNMYVEHPLETNRYTAGKEILIKVTTSERIYGNYVLPELRVRFSKSGIGKYIYSNDAKVGYAKPTSSIINIDGKTEWTYSYIVQEGDEGNVIAEYTKGTIIDRAGNITYLQDKYAVSNSTTDYKGINGFGKDVLINNIGFYKDENCTQEINLNRYQISDIYVKVELDDALYTGIREIINKENAPKLYLNSNIPTEVVSVKDGNTVIYKYDKSSVSNITLIDFITLKNEGVKLYYGQSTIAEGKGINVNSVYQVDVDNIYLDPNNVYNNLNGNGIYADTTLPTVDITAYKVDSLPTGTSVVKGEIVENDITNADIIRYRFKFSENVTGFTEDDITVNFATKSSVGLKKLNDKTYDLYVETNVEKESTKDVQIILEQDAVQDLVYQGNVRREKKITVDKKSPKLQSYTVREENGKIIVEATYDEAISDVSSSTLKIKAGNYDGKGEVITEILSPNNTVRYTYNKAGEDGGKVEITLIGKVIDMAGNSSEEMNDNIENDIIFTRTTIKDGNVEYSFKKNGASINDFTNPTYFKIGDSITVTRTKTIVETNENGEETTVYERENFNGIIPDGIELSQMKSMKLTDGSAEFSKNNNLETNIEAANIYFDTVVPVVTAKVEAKNPSQGAYIIGDELTITANSSEKVVENVRPEIEVKFANELGKFNNGIAQYVETKENENGTTSWIYRYVITDGDEGSIKLSYKAGKVTDIAGNSTTLSSLNNTENVFDVNNTVADTTLPAVVITPKDINNSITNKNEITYVFTWNEEVEGFNPNDITVNNGTKGTFEQDSTNNKVYTMKVITNVETGNTGDIQVIVEKDAVQDKAGHGNVRTENVIRVDKQAPILISLEAFANSDIKVNKEVDSVKQYYKAGDEVTIVATFSENIENSTVPTLSLEFSESGNAKGNVSNGVIAGNKITYTYTVTNEDNGRLSVKGFTGKVSDAAGNETVVTKRALDGDTVIADTVNPTLMALTAIAPEFEYDELVNGETEDSVRYGVQSKTRDKNTITIIATYSENIYNLSSNTINNITSSNAPTLKLRFGTSTERTATFQKIEGDKIYYTYNIASGDNGDLTITKLTGTVSDLAGNTLTTSTSLPTVTKYEAEVKDENKVNVIVADTTKPSYTITASAVDKDDNNNDITGNGNYYRKGSIITITAKTNEYVYKNNNKELTWFTEENAPILSVKFGELIGKGQIKCTDVQYLDNNTIFTYEYIIADGDNGTLLVNIAENTGYDIAVNGNNEKTQTISNIIADTVNPVTNWQSWVDSEAYGIEDDQNGTWTVTFSERLYSYNPDRHTVGSSVSTSSAPILLVSNDNVTPLETTISSITTLNNKTVITYKYSPYTRNIGAYGMKFASVSDKAGNLFNFKDQVAPILSSIKVTEPETGTYKAGNEITIIATFSEKVTGTAPTLKLKFGDAEAKGTVSTGVIEDNTITYKYTITDGDNGKLDILSLEGEGLADLYDNKWVAPENITLTGNTIIADTIAPTVVITANEEKTNKDTVIYTFTWSEDVENFTVEDIEVINGSKGTFTKVSGKAYTLEVDTTNEGRQIVKVPANVCTDIAGNENSERATYNNVVIDYTKPIVRAKINGGKYVIDEDSNKSTLKEIIVVNEEISKFEYTWSDEDTIPENGWTIYPNVDNITVNSDIPLATSVDSEGTYYLYMKVTDKAGNVFRGRTNGFVVSNDTITLTPNTTESTNQDITVTVSYGTQTTGLTQDRKAGVQGKTWSADSSVVIIPENGVVYAEAKDIAGNKVYETLEINNIDKTAPTAEITYNTNEDGSVTATITLSDGRVTNNEGKTTYTFNENGEFTFEYEDALGNKGTATAKVTTIDKHEDPQPQPEPQPEPQPTDEDNTAPEITFNYSTTSATVGTKIGSAITTNEDAKISYKWNNGQWKTSSDYIRSYNITYTPATAGTYTLYAKAEDKAGNVTDEKALVFTVVNSQEDIKDPEIEFNDLTVIQKNGVKYVKVSPTYTVEELNAKINKEKLLGVTPTFAKLTSAGKLRTGSEIKLNNTTKYIVIVNGDVNCDGKVDFINDIIMINNYRIGKINNLSEIQILAGDINNSGTIEFISDIISMNNYRLGNINVL